MLRYSWHPSAERIFSLCTALEFPDDAAVSLRDSFSFLQTHSDAMMVLEAARDIMFENVGFDYMQLLERAASLCNIKQYCVDLLFYLMCAEPLAKIYQQNHYSDDFLMEQLKDLRYKALECNTVHGYWGTASCKWHQGFFILKKLKLGRLQYVRGMLDIDQYRGIVRRGDPVLDCHIPSSGPLKPEFVYDSFKKAYDFFGTQRKDGLMVFQCNTWLLAPSLEPLFPQNGNLRAFYQIFDVISECEDPTNRVAWRIFGKAYQKQDVIDYPENTSLQRSIKRYLLSGKNLSDGYGIVIFDGKQVLR